MTVRRVRAATIAEKEKSKTYTERQSRSSAFRISIRLFFNKTVTVIGLFNLKEP